jgi:hypothetical protein
MSWAMPVPIPYKFRFSGTKTLAIFRKVIHLKLAETKWTSVITEKAVSDTSSPLNFEVLLQKMSSVFAFVQ